MMPLAVRTTGVEISPALRRRIETRLDRRLGKVASHVQRVTVRFKDQNGPRGGVDTLCRIKVVLSGLPSVLANETAADPAKAFSLADHRVERAVKRAITRGQARGLVAAGEEGAPGQRPVPRPTGKPAPHPATTRSNFKKRTGRAVAALEDSAQPRPSRKSTRGSVNRAKQANKLARRQTRRVTSPKRRAQVARASRT